MSAALLPDRAAWAAAAARRPELFQGLDAGCRVGLVARSALQTMLVWEANGGGIEVKDAAFAGYSDSGVDILLSANDEALAEIVAATDGPLFETLRSGIRSGAVVCYMLRRRCDLEAQGYEELLEALGFAFMGACR